jgi:hypothetical protein
MKLFIKTVITMTMCLVATISFEQDRTNREKLIFSDKSEILMNAVGWCYNSTLGEWIDYNNVIEEEKTYKEKFKLLTGAFLMSRHTQNFISIQTKTVIFKEIKYYVLIVEKWDGQYKYPSIYEDWYEYKTMCGYIFTETEYNKLNNIIDVVSLEIPYQPVIMDLRYEVYDEKVFLDKIQNNLDFKYKTEYMFPVKKIENGNIRFYVPDRFSTINNVDFNKQYFETTFDNFSKIVIK